MNVTLHTRPSCVQRGATHRALGAAGIEHTTIDVTENLDARDYLLSLGYRQAPSSSPTPTTGPDSDSTASRPCPPDHTPIAAEIHAMTSTDTEALCLCALLWTTPDTAARIVDTLTTADFYRPIYAELYDVIATLVRSGAPHEAPW